MCEEFQSQTIQNLERQSVLSNESTVHLCVFSDAMDATMVGMVAQKVREAVQSRCHGLSLAGGQTWELSEADGMTKEMVILRATIVVAHVTMALLVQGAMIAVQDKEDKATLRTCMVQQELYRQISWLYYALDGQEVVGVEHQGQQIELRMSHVDEGFLTCMREQNLLPQTPASMA